MRFQKTEEEEEEEEEEDYYDDNEEILISDEEEEDNDDDIVEEEEEEENNDDDDNVEEEEEEPSYDMTLVPTSSDSPYMVIHHQKFDCLQSFYSISKKTNYLTNVQLINGTTCSASYNGWLVLLENPSKQSIKYHFLLKPTPTSFEGMNLPPIKTSYSYDYCILTSSPPDCVVMFLSFEDNSCLFCRPNDQRWTKKKLGPKPDGVSSNSSFQALFGAVSCKGKIYINYGHGQGMKILDYKTHSTDQQRFTVEKIKFHPCGLMDSFGSFIAESQTSQYLVESCGEVFLVVRIYIGSSNLNTHSFSVYKLMNSSSTSTSTSTSKGDHIAWKRVESLGDDRVFFVARACSLSASASKAGLMENYIYFFHPNDPRYFCRFSMNTGSIYKSRSFPYSVDAHEPYWMISNDIV